MHFSKNRNRTWVSRRYRLSFNTILCKGIFSIVMLERIWSCTFLPAALTAWSRDGWQGGFLGTFTTQTPKPWDPTIRCFVSFKEDFLSVKWHGHTVANVLVVVLDLGPLYVNKIGKPLLYSLEPMEIKEP